MQKGNRRENRVPHPEQSEGWDTTNLTPRHFDPSYIAQARRLTPSSSRPERSEAERSVPRRLNCLCLFRTSLAVSLPSCRASRRSILASFNPLVQQLLSPIQHPQPALRQVLSGAVYIEGQHPHTGAWPLRRDPLRSQASRNRRSILLEQSLLGIGRLGIHPGRPLPLAMRAPMSRAPRRRLGAPCPLRRCSLRRCSLRACPPRPRRCGHMSLLFLSDANEQRFIVSRGLPESLRASLLSSFTDHSLIGQRPPICNRLITYRALWLADGAFLAQRTAAKEA
ncbi:MAG: hypothetical protein QOK38_1657 [Acidobacteriaceae bacterium]|nr:hypothetical protein [Acidobacteriaceae bacterium]